MKFFPLLFGGLAYAIPAATALANTYSGNGVTGFNGSVGNGILTITSTATTITFSEAPSGGNFGAGNALVLYIDSVTGGFADTSMFTDDGDGERTAVSGYDLNNANNGGATSQTVATFPTGFAADYAIAFDSGNPNNNPVTPANINGFTLVANGGNNSFGFLGNNQTTVNTSPYALTLNLSQLGLTATSSFKFVGTLISETAYRSDESTGTVTQTTGPGFNGALTFTSYDTYAVPEPASVISVGLGIFALAGVAASRRFRSA